jgi:NADP-dependent 3-hydroxy acid dehydrogenase YdfG
MIRKALDTYGRIDILVNNARVALLHYEIRNHRVNSSHGSRAGEV